MQFSVTVAAHQFEVIKVESYRRIPYVLRRDVSLVVNNNAWKDESSGNAPLAQTTPVFEIPTLCFPPCLTCVKAVCIVLSHNKDAPTSVCFPAHGKGR